MAEKQTNKDRMREIVDSIENGIKELFESDKYQQYLSTMSRFHRYSVNNTMTGLITSSVFPFTTTSLPKPSTKCVRAA